MWIKYYSEVFNNVKKEKIWELWSDVNSWNKWDPDIKYATIAGEFKEGSIISLKPKKGPLIKIKLSEIIQNRKFTNTFSFPAMTMFFIHEMFEENNCLRLTTTIQVSGLLGYIWRKLVAEDIVKTLPQQMHSLIQMAKNNE